MSLLNFALRRRVCPETRPPVQPLAAHPFVNAAFLLCADNYTHDVIALAGFGFDADSVRATKDRPCISFEAMNDLVIAFMKLIMDPLAM